MSSSYEEDNHGKFVRILVVYEMYLLESWNFWADLCSRGARIVATLQ